MPKLAEFATQDVVVAPSDWTVSRCAREMAQREIRHLPILDDERRPVGMITDGRVHGLIRRDLGEVPAHRVSDAWPAQVSADADLRDALATLAFGQLDAVLVLDQDGRLAGILTEHDVVRLALDTLPADMKVSDAGSVFVDTVVVPQQTQAVDARAAMYENGTRHVLAVDDQGRLSGVVSLRDLAGRDSTTVGARLHAPVYTARAQGSLFDAAHTMVEHQVGCLPVVGPNRTPVGVITRTDIVRAVLDRLNATEA